MPSMKPKSPIRLVRKALFAAAAAVVFLLVAAFVWLADLYDALTAGVVLGCAFALIALMALVACLMTRRRNMERARLELAARSNTSWLDPKLVAVGVQIGQAIGWRRLAWSNELQERHNGDLHQRVPDTPHTTEWWLTFPSRDPQAGAIRRQKSFQGCRYRSPDYR